MLSQTDSSTNSIATLNPLRYRSYVYDQESGFYYLQSRYYDPQTGRFLNADDTAYLGATGTALSCNLFAYCENDAINKIDTDGYSPKNIEEYVNDKTGKSILGAGDITIKFNGNKMTINAYLNIKGKLSKKEINNTTYKKLFLKGIKQYWKGTFKVFKKYKVELKTNVYESKKSFTDVTMKNRYGVCSVKHGIIPWCITNYGEVTMYKGDNRNQVPLFTSSQFKYAAAHEFAHLLGLSDGYKVNYSPLPKSITSKFFAKVTNRDVQKVIKAFIQNKKQEW